jgi:uncharacterized protein YndB with AHSA1/START domain
MAAPQSKPDNTPDFTLEVRRTFSAPREKVFAAFAVPGQLEQWMCRDAGSHITTHRLQDIRPGGRYLIEVRDPAKNETYWGQGQYLEVTPPERIRFTWRWTRERPDGENLHAASPDTEVAVEFRARGSSTEVILTHSGFHDAPTRKEHETGWNGCLDILGGVLQQS